jgi:hypothetical protein
LEKYGCSKPTPVAKSPTKVTTVSRFQYGTTKRSARLYCTNHIREVGFTPPRMPHSLRFSTTNIRCYWNTFL